MHNSEEYRDRMSRSQIKSWYNTPGKIERMSETTTNRFKKPEEREKTRQGTLRAYRNDPTILTRMGATQSVRLSDPEVRKATSIGVKIAQILDPSIMINTHRGRALAHTHLTRLEEIVYNVIEDYKLPYTYNGSTGKVIIGNRTPDFIHKTKPLVIEAFGEYWHNFKDEIELVNHYRKHSHKALILWQNEILESTDEDLFFIILAFGDSYGNSS